MKRREDGRNSSHSRFTDHPTHVSPYQHTRCSSFLLYQKVLFPIPLQHEKQLQERLFGLLHGKEFIDNSLSNEILQYKPECPEVSLARKQ